MYYVPPVIRPGRGPVWRRDEYLFVLGFASSFVNGADMRQQLGF